MAQVDSWNYYVINFTVNVGVTGWNTYDGFWIPESTWTNVKFQGRTDSPRDPNWSCFNFQPNIVPYNGVIVVFESLLTRSTACNHESRI